MQTELAPSLEQIVQQYASYNQEVLGLRPATCALRLRWTRLWLAHLAVTSRRELQRLSSAQLIAGLRDPPANVTAASLAGVVCGLRCFLRYLHSEGHLTQLLVFALPPVARPPRPPPESLSGAQLQGLLKTADRRRALGRRDYAILICAVRLGLRAGEIAALQLKDVDWDNGTVRLEHPKNRHATLLPLCPTVGQALVAYLQRGRPRTLLPQLFVSARRPYRALANHSITKIARRALLRAGLVVHRYGAHVLRRTFAMRLTERGTSLKMVADLLRHQHLGTTLRYVKATRVLLAKVVQPWPEVRP
jgi:integrase